MKLNLKWIYCLLAFWPAALLAQDETALQNEVNQLRSSAAPLFAMINAGNVQGKVWISGKALEEVVASIDPVELTYTQSGHSIDSSGYVPSPGGNCIPMKAWDVWFGAARLYICYTEGSLKGNLKAGDPIGTWTGPQPPPNPPFRIAIPANLKLSTEIVGWVKTFNPLTPDVKYPVKISIATTDTAQIGLNLFRDSSEHLRYQISYEGPAEFQASARIDPPILAYSQFDVTFKVTPRTLWESELKSNFKNEGALTVKYLPRRDYRLQFNVKDLVHASDGIESLYQVILTWTP